METTGPFDVLEVNTVTIKENSVAVAVSRDRVSESPTVREIESSEIK